MLSSGEEERDMLCSACCAHEINVDDCLTTFQAQVVNSIPLTMAKVIQQRSLPASPARQSSLTSSCRLDDMQATATQSAELSALCNGKPLWSSPSAQRPSDASPLPTLDLAPMLALTGADLPEQVQQLCQAVASCLRDTGCLIVRDPRVNAEDNTCFLDMMERYFAQSTEAKLTDTRPKLHFQVSSIYQSTSYLKGVSPQHTCLGSHPHKSVHQD